MEFAIRLEIRRLVDKSILIPLFCFDDLKIFEKLVPFGSKKDTSASLTG
jgi:hypothetical protein